MIFDYLFLSSRFNKFAYQSEWLSVISTQFDNSSSSDLYKKYINCRETMANKMVTFNNETNTSFRWLKSFIPATTAYHARRQLGYQLTTANKLFFDISLNYLKSNKEKVKAVERAKPKINEEKKNEKTNRPVVWRKYSADLDNEVDKPHLSDRGMWATNSFKRC